MNHVRIVLVEPSHPGNIGAAARAMKTMGFTSLHLVRPARFPDPQADWRAAQAVDVVENATVVDALEDAIGDCTAVFGTSARARRIPWPSMDAATAAAQLAVDGAATAPAAILFGREASGLTNAELQRCQHHIVIPAHPGYPSLNLAMAVQVVCYELFKAAGGTAPEVAPDRRLATVAAVDGFHAHLEATLRRIDFLKDSAPRQAMTRFRRLFARAALDETELGMLRGLLTHVDELAKRAGRSGAGAKR